MTAEDIERWLTGTMDEALELQKPANDDAVVMTAEKVAAPL
jgi:putative SOS response-associated peptidase YedK